MADSSRSTSNLPWGPAVLLSPAASRRQARLDRAVAAERRALAAAAARREIEAARWQEFRADHVALELDDVDAMSTCPSLYRQLHARRVDP